MTEPLSSNQTLGPPDILCPKCGEYIMCPDVYEREIERLTAEIEKMAGDHALTVRELGDADRRNARLRSALEKMARGTLSGERCTEISREALAPMLWENTYRADEDRPKDRPADENRSGPRNTGDDAGAVTRTTDETTERCVHGRLWTEDCNPCMLERYAGNK